MKIAYLLGSLNRGGTETLLLDVFRNAKLNKLDAIGVYRKSGVLETEFLESGVLMTKLPYTKNFLSYFFRLRRLLINHNIKLIHAQQPLDALFAWIAAPGLGIKIILTLHGYDFNESFVGKIILRFILKRTDANIYVSKTQSRYYQVKYKLRDNRQRLVYNGISFEKFDGAKSSSTHSMTSSHTMSKENTLRDKLKLTPDKMLFGTVGNFLPGRDQLLICNFLNLLKKKEVPFHFIFVGKRIENFSNLYDDCVKYCKQNNLFENVSFLGSRDDVLGILQQLDAFVYATEHDTFGIGVVEAMAVGVPVFVNDWEVMTEITDNGKFVTLYKSKNEKDLLRHFLLFLQDKTSFEIKASEAAVFVREKYSIEKHIENLKQVYNN